jgi:hypothetical protein
VSALSFRSKFVFYTVVGFKRNFQISVLNLVRNMVAFPVYVKVGHFCLVGKLM